MCPMTCDEIVVLNIMRGLYETAVQLEANHNAEQSDGYEAQLLRTGAGGRGVTKTKSLENQGLRPKSVLSFVIRKTKIILISTCET